MAWKGQSLKQQKMLALARMDSFTEGTGYRRVHFSNAVIYERRAIELPSRSHSALSKETINLTQWGRMGQISTRDELLGFQDGRSGGTSNIREELSKIREELSKIWEEHRRNVWNLRGVREEGLKFGRSSGGTFEIRKEHGRNVLNLC